MMQGSKCGALTFSQRTVDMVLQGKNPTGDPDVDKIVPQPGAENGTSLLQLLRLYLIVT